MKRYLCPKCRKEKNVNKTNFYFNNKHITGIGCKDCQKEYVSNRYKNKNKKWKRENYKRIHEWRINNPEKVKEYRYNHFTRSLKEIIREFGPSKKKPRCKCCGEKNIGMLMLKNQTLETKREDAVRLLVDMKYGRIDYDDNWKIYCFNCIKSNTHIGKCH